jgi:hypothetical protein
MGRSVALADKLKHISGFGLELTGSEQAFGFQL